MENPHHDPQPTTTSTDRTAAVPADGPDPTDPVDTVLPFDVLTDTPTNYEIAVTRTTLEAERPGLAPSELGHELAELVRDTVAYTGRRVDGRVHIRFDTPTDTLRAAATLVPAETGTTGGHDHG